MKRCIIFLLDVDFTLLPINTSYLLLSTIIKTKNKELSNRFILAFLLFVMKPIAVILNMVVKRDLIKQILLTYAFKCLDYNIDLLSDILYRLTISLAKKLLDEHILEFIVRIKKKNTVVLLILFTATLEPIACALARYLNKLLNIKIIGYVASKIYVAKNKHKIYCYDILFKKESIVLKVVEIYNPCRVVIIDDAPPRDLIKTKDKKLKVLKIRAVSING